ncbi:competence type IV pilus ATPase ComGA [Streptococcus sp. DD12]|uniref:competence type IV pilus ATPase ComGA n=1 Tax=Streptococcus sp. DD12 TaxID=1777880 RepID=UPI00079B42F4|nr:competence type IV pilus ATPase ComGA [Streptococcus sp. DD12]KXT75383.1 Late competence protein ComGA, access of DNA to ComEA [Streptococcus sp. DD12]
MVQRLAKDLIAQAVQSQAQDIYLIPRKDEYECFLRVGDKRQAVGTYPLEKGKQLISHFKFLAGMNVGEQRRTQLGSCDYLWSGHQTVSLRLSSVGDYRSLESLVLRVLYDGERDLNFWFSGFEQVESILAGRGLYLFSGPVGSGKTSLMYQLARTHFKNQQTLTIEDPVEIKQEDMLQLQLNDSIGMTYDNLIKLSLRHRPDLLIIGEIRDSETARAVIRASLTGATVFSTIHAKSIPGVYARLIELGVSPQELANCLQGIIYQRLIAGGGLIDVADKDFKTHKPTQWNAQLDQLALDGHLTELQKETEKIRP